eukprot:TRINITY_DN44509_c0_g1_i1.p2 TRINITY_DN44509_c0_g1~~TRINITY_DN44509_c0_g1_i1.p2  ORF type:complete len:235 (+),score=69.15 TRINITY_DN44509_c0_g1_i1:107-706(+)
METHERGLAARKGSGEMSSIGYDDSKPTPRQNTASYQGPCLWWLQNQQSGCEEDQDVQTVSYERRIEAATSLQDAMNPMTSLLENTAVETIEVMWKKGSIGEVVARIDCEETALHGRAVLQWRSGSNSPRIVFPQDNGFVLPLPPQRPHLALLLPELCFLFTEANIQHNLHKWGIIDEALPPVHQQNLQQECHCQCSLM